LDITHAWVEKTGSIYHFKLMLDPRDETGFNPNSTIVFRSQLNTTAALPASAPFQYYPWQRGVPMDIAFNCTAIVIEVEARDAAGNKSVLQRRTFKAPFPISPEPNLNPRFGSTTLSLQGTPLDCRGLFAGNFDGAAYYGDDIAQVDRTSGNVIVRRQDLSVTGFTENTVISLTPDTIDDSACADIDLDGRLDLLIVASNTLSYYHNDGVGGGGQLEFSPVALSAMTAVNMTAITSVAVCDLTGEGKPEVVVSGTVDDGMGGELTKVVWLINDGTWQLNAWNAALAPGGASPGRIAGGDVTGDGANDLVMVDSAGNQLIVFQNKGQALAGADDATPSLQPYTAPTGGFFGVPAHAIAVGDVTGDGRADVVATCHWFGSSNGIDPNDTRDHLLWQLFDSRAGSLHPNNVQLLGNSDAAAASSTPFQSDVMIQELTKDRFPEIIFTNKFAAGPPGQPAGGILTFRLVPYLDSVNELTLFDLVPVPFYTGRAAPHRLAAPRFGGNATRDILVANNDTPPLTWIFNTSNPIVSNATDIIGGVSTTADPDGTAEPNGARSYFECPDGVIDYSLTYVNNTTSALTNATIESLVPNTVQILAAESDAGHVIVPSGTSTYIRWTETVGAGSAGVKRFRARVPTGAKAGTVIAPANKLKVGTTVKASSTMPKVTVDDPISLELVRVETDSDPYDAGHPNAIVGQSVHFDEVITYKFKVTNRGTQTLTNTVVGMAMPPGTIFNGPVSTIPGTTATITSDRIDFTVLSLTPGASQEMFVNVEVREKVGSLVTKVGGYITNSTITALRPGGQKRTLPPIKTLVAPLLQITAEANKTQAAPGEIIEYTLRAKNWSASYVTSARVVAQIPPGTKLVSAHGRMPSGDFTDFGAPLPAFALRQDTNPGYHVQYTFEAAGKPASPPRWLLSWNLGDIEAGDEVLVQYRVMVGMDAPSSILVGGTPSGLSAVANYYNFYATTSSGARVFALPSAVDATVSKSTTPLATINSLLANPFNVLPGSPVTPIAVSITPPSGGIDLPSLQLTKTAWGPRDPNALDPYDSDPDTATYSPLKPETVGGATYSTVQKNAVYSYALHYSNYGNGPATNAFIHDEIPTNTTFLGWIAKDRKLVESLTFSRFYNAQNLEVPPGGEYFYDNNGDGKWTPAYTQGGKKIAAEWFDDKNRNGKYDGITDIRSFDLYVGNVPAGEFHRYFYQVQVNSGVKEGTDIISTYGGIDGLPNGLDFSAKQGYYMTAENLYFPVNGGPHQVKVKVVAPTRPRFLLSLKGSPVMANTPPSGAPAPRDLSGPGGEVVTMTMPFDIPGPGSLSTPASVFMDVPVGYEVVDAVMKDSTGANVVTYLANATGANRLANIWNSVASGKGPCRVTFPCSVRNPSYPTDATKRIPMRFGWPILKLRFDPSRINTSKPDSTLFNADGSTKIPLVVKVIISGTGLAMQTGQIQIDARGNTTKDSKVFVGRAAPMSAPRGGLITYTIFVGNLTSLRLDVANIKMNVPTGCDYVGHTSYHYNAHLAASPYEDGPQAGWQGVYEAKSKQVTWPIGLMKDSEGGAVTLTVRVRSDFTGNSIDDSSCLFSVKNAVGKSPGPLSVAVRTGNVEAQDSEILQRCLQGASYKHNDAIVTTLRQNFAMTEDSQIVTIGGADFLHLSNGAAVIPMPSNRVMLVGPPGLIVPNSDAFARLLADQPGLRVCAGPGGEPNVGVRLVNVPGYAAGQTAPNVVLRDLATASSVLKNGAANLICGSGLNLVRSGGADFTELPPLSSTEPDLILPDTDEEVPIPVLYPISTAVAQGLLRPVDPNAPGVVQAGNGSAAVAPVSGLPGLLLAGGSAGVVATDGAGLVGQDGAGLVGQDGAGVVAIDGAGVVAIDGAGLVGQDGAGLVGQDGAGLVGQDGAGVASGGAGNLFSGGNGNPPK